MRAVECVGSRLGRGGQPFHFCKSLCLCVSMYLSALSPLPSLLFLNIYFFRSQRTVPRRRPQARRLLPSLVSWQVPVRLAPHLPPPRPPLVSASWSGGHVAAGSLYRVKQGGIASRWEVGKKTGGSTAKTCMWCACVLAAMKREAANAGASTA